MRTIIWAMAIVMLQATHASAQGEKESPGANLLAGNFCWTTAGPVVHPKTLEGEDWIAVKDPSVVRFENRWHLFCTVRGTKRSHAIIYLSFSKWDQAADTKQYVLNIHDGYHCAPQVFFHRPHKKWYLICQATFGNGSFCDRVAAYSTSSDISDPNSWSKLKPLGANKADGKKSAIDFWIICDDDKAHLFFTTLDGQMWREETHLEDFPAKWSSPKLALRGDFLEASHTYRLKGMKKYLTLVEAQRGHGARYYKAYLADTLDGKWKPIAAEKDKAFASMRNVTHSTTRWTDRVSHIELLRSGYDQQLEVDLLNLRFVFQGVLEKDRPKTYGKIPWKLGILETSKN